MISNAALGEQVRGLVSNANKMLQDGICTTADDWRCIEEDLRLAASRAGAIARSLAKLEG